MSKKSYQIGNMLPMFFIDTGNNGVVLRNSEVSLVGQDCPFWNHPKIEVPFTVFHWNFPHLEDTDLENVSNLYKLSRRDRAVAILSQSIASQLQMLDQFRVGNESFFVGEDPDTIISSGCMGWENAESHKDDPRCLIFFLKQVDLSLTHITMEYAVCNIQRGFFFKSKYPRGWMNIDPTDTTLQQPLGSTPLRIVEKALSILTESISENGV